MYKLQQFDIYSLNFTRLKNNHYNIDLSYEQAKINEEIIQVADSEVLRAIRRVTKHPYDKEKLDEFLLEKKRLIRKTHSIETKERLKYLNKEIGVQLFIPEYVSVTTEKKVNYKTIGKNGFFINNVKYKRLLCSASHARTNRTIFVKEEIHKEINNILKNGISKVKLVAAKYNAYFSLTSSATYIVSQPRVCVVADKEITMLKNVDYVTEDSYQDIVTKTDKEITFNLFDGMGIISPSFAEIWAKELGLDYLPSGFCIRCAYIKGMLCVFDFHQFSKEIANKDKVKDIYGVEYNINDIDVFLTESQFKLYNAYTSFQHYEHCLKKSQINWGVSKVTPKEDKNYIRTNYQFLQVLNLDNADIKELCNPTIEWLKGVSGEDIDKCKMYLLGKLAKEKNTKKLWDSIQEDYLKAIILDPKLAEDTYIKNRIINSLNKKIKESYIGKLIIGGNFQTMFNDPYAFCEYVFDMPIKGLLREHEHYSYYWNCKGDKKVAALRSPLTWRSEVNELNLQNNPLLNKWFKYITSGIIYNVWGYDHLLHAGSDLDGDLVCTTNNSVFLKCRNGGIPVYYDPKKAEKVEINESILYKVDALSYNTKIGFITNCSTTLYEMQSCFEKDSMEYNEINVRLKLCCKEQSATIDSAKGVKCKPFPKHWTRRISHTDKVLQEINHKLVIDKRPYFMIYLYPIYKKEYTAFRNDLERYCKIMFGCGYQEVIRNNKKYFDNKEDFKSFIDNAAKKNPVLETNGSMNKICYYMEYELKELTKSYTKKFNQDIFDKLYNHEIVIDNDDLEKMNLLYNQYCTFKKSQGLHSSDFFTYEQYYKNLRENALYEINTNIQYLSNLALKIAYIENNKKEFVWDCFSKGLVLNLLEKNNIVSLPQPNNDGNVEYLFENYKMVDYEIT